MFDDPVDAASAADFLADPRHHICVAIEADEVVGFASGVIYVHPDKPVEMWTNEVGTGVAWRGRGVVAGLLDHARTLGCREAWVQTGDDNTAARALYRSAGGVEQNGQLFITFAL